MDLPDLEIELGFLTLEVDSLSAELPGKSMVGYKRLDSQVKLSAAILFYRLVLAFFFSLENEWIELKMLRTIYLRELSKWALVPKASTKCSKSLTFMY